MRERLCAGDAIATPDVPSDLAHEFSGVRSVEVAHRSTGVELSPRGDAVLGIHARLRPAKCNRAA